MQYSCVDDGGLLKEESLVGKGYTLVSDIGLMQVFGSVVQLKKNELVAGVEFSSEGMTLLVSCAGTLVMDRQNEGIEDSPCWDDPVGRER